jgi:LCP family protein required for cell wall assembly
MTDATGPRSRRGTTPSGREQLRRQLKAGFRRSLSLTTLGTVIPGAGLTQTRSKRLGWIILTFFILVGVAVGYVVMRDGITNAALSLVARPSLLQAAAVAFVIIGILWCGSIILTAIQSRPTRLDRTRTRTLAALTTVLVFLVAGSTFKVAEYTLITTDTVKQVFSAGATLPPGQGAEIVEGDDPWAETPRVNILLLGSDAGVGRTGTRTDSMIVASIDTKTGRTALISLPRNLERAPIPASSPLRKVYPSGVYGRPTCLRGPHECLLNAIWAEADEFKASHPEAYAGQASAGRVEIRDVISEILGLKIDHTVVIDLKGFEQLIDAMGGVDVNVKLSGNNTKLPIGGHSDGNGGVIGEKGFFNPGRQHLTGNLALWYARTRAADDDSYRQARQRCVIRAVVEQVNPAAMLGKYPDLARIAKDNIYTDIPASSLAAFVDLAERIQKGQIVGVALTAKQGIYAGNPDYDLVRSIVKKAITTPPPAATPSTTPSTPKPTSTKTKTPATPSPTTTPYEQC